MSASIFIDGEAGTTGLLVRELLSMGTDLSFISLGESERKNNNAKKRCPKLV